MILSVLWKTQTRILTTPLLCSKTTVVPMFHTAKLGSKAEIMEAGFSTPASQTMGNFGRGVYFTRDLGHAVQRQDPSQPLIIVLSLVLPGNAYPVTESLQDGPCQAGHQSHYAKVSGSAIDELVVFDSAQALPLFFLQFPPPAREAT